MHVLLLNSICITYYRENLSRDKKEPEKKLVQLSNRLSFQKISAFKAPAKAITKAINLFSRLFQIKYQQISRYTSGSNRK